MMDSLIIISTVCSFVMIGFYACVITGLFDALLNITSNIVDIIEDIKENNDFYRNRAYNQGRNFGLLIVRINGRMENIMSNKLQSLVNSRIEKAISERVESMISVGVSSALQSIDIDAMISSAIDAHFSTESTKTVETPAKTAVKSVEKTPVVATPEKTQVATPVDTDVQSYNPPRVGWITTGPDDPTAREVFIHELNDLSVVWQAKRKDNGNPAGSKSRCLRARFLGWDNPETADSQDKKPLVVIPETTTKPNKNGHLGFIGDRRFWIDDIKGDLVVYRQLSAKGEPRGPQYHSHRSTYAPA